jgi:PAS domain S-box-containing protein
MKTGPIKVLLIDDDEDDYILTCELFSLVKAGKYALDWASSYEEGLRIAAQREHHVCLVDHHLGEHSGVELIREARKSRLTTPMIMLTGSGDHDVDVEAMEAGATDYLVKNETSPARLERTIRYAVQLNTDRCRAEEELEAYAQKQTVVAEIGRLALSGGDLKDLFAKAVSLIAKTLGVEYCEVLELMPDVDELVLRAGVGWNEKYLVGQTSVSAGKDSQAGFTLLSTEPVVVEDFSTETRFGVPAIQHHGVASGMSVTIRGREHPYGVLGAHTTSLRRFHKDDVNLLFAIANVLADAIDRKRAEDEVRQSEARFRRVVESNVLGIVSLDVSGEIIEANDAFLKMVGYTQADLDAGRMRFSEMTPPEYHELDEKALGELAASGVCETYEKEFVRKDGTRIPILLSIATFEGGKQSGVSFVVDLTERRKLEQQLHQSQKLESVGMLAGGIAHDFNNLLTVISGYSELTLRRLGKVDPLAGNLEEISKAAERATVLTRQLLAFSRKQVLQPKVLDLNAVIVDIEKMLGRLVGEDMELRTVPGAELGQVKADPGQIEQVILNLVVNARDAMPEGGKITIETANVYLGEDYVRQHIAVHPGWYVMLAVTDSGNGMDAETQKSIFEPFFTTKEPGKGTGLGLSTVYGIVKQSGGNIWVYSEVGVGTSFKIYLPLVDEQVTETAADEVHYEGVGGNETILLAEDEEMVRNLARDSLKMHGYRVLDAANAGEALLISQHHKGPIHLLLTDAVMPRMSGKELAEQLGKLRPDTRILYMSGYTDRAIVHHGVLAEDIAFIGKPFTPDALVLKVAEVLQQIR